MKWNQWMSRHTASISEVLFIFLCWTIIKKSFFEPKEIGFFIIINKIFKTLAGMIVPNLHFYFIPPDYNIEQGS